MATPLLNSVANDNTACAGLPADTYDRYVLGLLDRSEKAHVERELEQQCPACIAGVQRSISLWLVFAGSLDQVEPSADFRARLIRIADLSNRVLTVPKRYKRVREPAILVSSLIVIGLIMAVMLYFAYLAGKQKARRDLWVWRDSVARKQEQLIEDQDKLSQEEAKFRSDLVKAAPEGDIHLRDQLVKAQAQIQQDQALITGLTADTERVKQEATDSSKLVSALGNPGVRLLTFKSPDGAASSAYAFVIENSKIVFVASNLTPPAEQHQYELWMIRKSDHQFVSLKIFSVDKEVPTVITLDNQADGMISDLAGLIVTDEASGGGSVPSATRVLETAGAAGVPTPVTPTPQPDAQ